MINIHRFFLREPQNGSMHCYSGGFRLYQCLTLAFQLGNFLLSYAPWDQVLRAYIQLPSFCPLTHGLLDFTCDYIYHPIVHSYYDLTLLFVRPGPMIYSTYGFQFMNPTGAALYPIHIYTSKIAEIKSNNLLHCLSF